MKKLFLPYGLSLLAKQKGFDNICFALVTERDEIHPMNISDSQDLEFNQQIAKYNNVPCVPAPLYDQIISWLRIKHNIVISHIANIGSMKEFTFIVVHNNNIRRTIDKPNYHESRDEAIEEAFKLI